MLPNVRPYSGFSNLGLQERWSVSFGLGRTTKKNCRLLVKFVTTRPAICNWWSRRCHLKGNTTPAPRGISNLFHIWNWLTYLLSWNPSDWSGISLIRSTRSPVRAQVHILCSESVYLKWGHLQRNQSARDSPLPREEGIASVPRAWLPTGHEAIGPECFEAS